MVKICKDKNVLNTLKELNPNLDINHFKRKREINIALYYQNNKIKCYFIYDRTYRNYSVGTYLIYDFWYDNKISLIKAFIGSFKANTYIDIYKKHLSIDYNKLLQLSELNNKKIKYYQHKEYVSLFIDYSINKLLYMNNLCYKNDDIIKIYMDLSKNNNFDTKTIEHNKEYIVGKLSNKILLNINDFIKDDKIRFIVEKRKRLYKNNNGEKKYIDKLKKSGYKKINNENKINYLGKQFLGKDCNKYIDLIIYDLREVKLPKTPYKGTLSYYRNVFKFIYKNYNVVKYISNDDFLYSNIYIPTIKTYMLNSYIKNGYYLEKIYKLIDESLNFNEKDKYFLKNKNSFYIHCKQMIGEEKALLLIKKIIIKIQNKINKLKKNNNYSSLDSIITIYHDLIVVDYKPILYSNIYTKKSKEILLLSNNIEKSKNFTLELEGITNIILRNSSSEILKKIRLRISILLRKGISFYSIIKEFSKYSNEIIFKRYPFMKNINEELAQNYINKCRKYTNKNITLLSLIYNFKDKVINILNGSLPCIFDEDILDDRRELLGKYIKELLGTRKKKGILENPKKLFTALNKIYPIFRILEGDFPIDKIESILNELNKRGISYPEEIDFYIKIEKKGSPEYIMAGDITNCCMDFGSEKLIDYVLEKGFGIISLYYKNNIISNSVIWIQDKLNYLILDNIECKTNHLNKKNEIKNQYFKIVEFIKNKYNLDGIAQGCDYNDIELYEDINYTNAYEIELEGKEIEDDFYSDAEEIIPISAEYNKKLENILKKIS